MESDLQNWNNRAVATVDIHGLTNEDLDKILAEVYKREFWRNIATRKFIYGSRLLIDYPVNNRKLSRYLRELTEGGYDEETRSV